MPNHPSQRRLVECAVAKRGNQRQPEPMQGTIEARSLVHLLEVKPETGQ